MKNNELQRNIAEILAKPNVVVEKNSITKNAINVFVAEPFEDIGTYLYYEREEEFKTDLAELNKLIAEKNGKNKN